MDDATKLPAGEKSVLDTGSQTPPTETTPEVKAPNPQDAEIASIKEQLANAQQMIGKQSSEVKQVRELKKQLETMQAQKPAEPAGPTIEDQINEITRKQEEGELGLGEGNRLIASLSASLGKEQTLKQIRAERQQEETAKMQQNFLAKNPDFNEALDSGALDQYLEADPLNDPYSAFKDYKADQRLAAKEEEHKAALVAAREEGAKVASGAENAGRVLGKTGSAMRPTGEVKKFANQKEETAAMADVLKSFRSASAQ